MNHSMHTLLSGKLCDIHTGFRKQGFLNKLRGEMTASRGEWSRVLCCLPNVHKALPTCQPCLVKAARFWDGRTTWHEASVLSCPSKPRACGSCQGPTPLSAASPSHCQVKIQFPKKTGAPQPDIRDPEKHIHLREL